MSALPHDTNIESLRLPPHSIEAEQAVLGALLLTNAAWDIVADHISEQDFYRADHRIIWRTITRQIEENKPADVLTIADALKSSGHAQEVGLAYVHQLASGTPSSANVRRYSEIVRNYSILRQLVAAAVSIEDAAYNGRGRDVREIIDDAEKRILSVTESGVRRSSSFQSMSEVLTEVMTRLDELHRNPTSVTGIATGYVDLDDMTAGFQPGDLIVVAARPGMGKTTLALNIAENVALDSKFAVLVFSMEMSGSQLATRILSSHAKVDSHRLRTGRVDAQDWDRMSATLGKINVAPIHIDSTPALTPLELRARARRKRRELGGVGLVIIDYLQLMQPPGNGSETRATAIGDITRSLKSLAREFSCPVMVLSQLNRSLEGRPNKRPVMADLRDSGAVEQDADTILFIYRDEVYNEDSPDKGIAEIIVGKQRNGPIGTVKLTFMGKHTRFENYSGAPGYDNGHARTPRAPRKPPRPAFTETDK